MNAVDLVESILLRDPVCNSWQLTFLAEHRGKRLQARATQDERGTAFILVAEASNPAEDFIHAYADPPRLAREMLAGVRIRADFHLRSARRDIGDYFTGPLALREEEALSRLAARRAPVNVPGTERVIVLGPRHAACLSGESDGRFEGGDGFMKRLAEFRTIYGIVEDGRVVAHAAVQVIGYGVCEVRKVWSDPSRRGEGLAKAVVAVTTAECLRIGRYATYSALASNRASLAVAKACGFAPVRTIYRWKGRNTAAV